MEELIIAKYVQTDDGHYRRELTTELVRKNDAPKPTYRGIKLFNKTPVAMRGTDVVVGRNSVKAGVFYEPYWVVREKGKGKILAYAKEIYLKDVNLSLVEGLPQIEGTVSEPTDELKALTEPLGYTDKCVVKAKSCGKCSLIPILNVPLLRLSTQGAFTS
jgi:hypothetical protein